MISFLFGWLGAAGFWFLYGTLTLFMGTLLLRVCKTKTYEFITRKMQDGDNYDSFECIIVAILFYMLWPFILMWLIFWNIMKIAFGMIFGPAIRKTITFADSLIPSVEIKIKK